MYPSRRARQRRSGARFSCGTACQARRELWVGFCLGRVEPEVRRLGAVEQAAGPRCQGWSARRAKPEDERPLTLGWRLLRHPEPAALGGGRARWCAGRASRSWIEPPPVSCTRVGTAVCVCAAVGPTLCSPPVVPDSRERPGIGSASAGGWRVAGGPAVAGVDRRNGRAKMVTSRGSEFGPHEPGKLAGDRRGDGGLGLFAGGEMTESSTQA